MNNPMQQPDSTAVRVALWRALHVEVDAMPHVLEDTLGLQLAAPPDDWRNRPDMHPQHTSSFRASIVGRARLVEDMIASLIPQGINQYVLLGAGLDTFALRHPALASSLSIFEVDQPGHVAWKQHRLSELGFNPGRRHHFVPVDFEAGDNWIDKLQQAGFDLYQPALVASTGVSMYLTHEAIQQTFQQVATLAKGSCFVMTFLLPIDMAEPELQPFLRMAEQGAKASGTPFISYFKPEQMLALVQPIGFSKVEYISTAELASKYFSKRSDSLCPPNNTEAFVVVTV